jgi:hypothetical protein
MLVIRVALLALAVAALGAISPPPRPFAIEVVDDQTGRGVPLVELRTVNEVRSFTDSSGIAAIDEPGLAGQKVYFHLQSHGYELPADGFGNRGVALQVEPGGSARIKIRRLNIAERLYRLTGEGIYRDSVLLGRPVPIRQPLLNAQVFGSDSTQTVIYQGKLFWFWGDTSRPGYPLGNFHASGATAALPGKGGLDPDRGVNLEYFVSENGFAKEMAPIPGSGPTWISGLITLPEGGRERLFAAYEKIKPPLESYERGLARFEDERLRFERVASFPLDAPAYPFGHPIKRRENGTEYVFFGDPFPLVRVRADAAALLDPTQYEAYSCLREGSRLASPVIDLDGDGAARYAWRRNTPAVGPEAQAKLIREGKLRREEALFQLQDPDTGKPITAHRGTVTWNPYRRRWIMVATEIGGTSMLGEVWYAEAKTPLGPWVYARKIVTHNWYSFYNPLHHPYFNQDGGRRIYFEGTYTHTFSGNPEPTPRYDYNQVMYRLDLADPRLTLPAPVSASPGNGAPFRMGSADGGGGRAAAFFALDRPGARSVPVYWHGGRLVARKGTGQPLFHALPADAEGAPATTVALYEWFSEKDGARRYSVETQGVGQGWRRGREAVCRVWRRSWAGAVSE